MESKYTPGPLHIAYGTAFNEQGFGILKADRDDEHTTPTERDANIAHAVKAWNLLPEVERVLRDCITESGAMAEQSHAYALRRLQAINEDVRALLAKLQEEKITHEDHQS